MKNKQILILSIFLCFIVKSFAQITFSDANFKNALLTHTPVIDTNGNNEIELSEAAATTNIYITNKNISNLRGIEYFTNLVLLDCSDNNIKEIKTETLTKLRTLIAERNKLTTIDVRNCILATLRLRGNPIEYAYLIGANTFQMEDIYGIDFGHDHTPNMKYVCISTQQYGTQITNVNHQERVWDRLGTALHIDECSIQTPITCQPINFPDPNFKQALLNHSPIIDTDGDGEICIEEAKATTSLSILPASPSLGISSINGIEHFTNLNLIYLDGNFDNYNAIDNMDFSKNTKLKTLYLPRNKTKNINITKNTSLETLSITSNLLTSIDISKNAKLKYLHIGSNSLTELNTTYNTELIGLSIDHNKVSKIDITKSTKLSSLYVQSNQLTKINTTNNPLLTYLYIQQNKITNLDISKNTKLFDLNVKQNLIEEIDIRKCNSLTNLEASSNPNLKRLYLTGNHAFYDNFNSWKHPTNPNFEKIQIHNCPNLSFVCVNNVSFLKDIKAFIINKYPSCIVSTSCTKTIPKTNFDLYFTLSPNPTDSFLKLTLKNTKIPILYNASIYNAQTGVFIKSFPLNFNSPFNHNNKTNPRGEPNPNDGTSPYYNPKQQIINCNDINKGVYTLTIQTRTGVLTKKFFKK